MDSSKRARNRAACRRCQRRKIRCDGKKPSCSGCQKAGVDCVNDGMREVTRSYIVHMENRIKWLESIIRERCSDIDLNIGIEGHLEAQDESGTEATAQHDTLPTQSSMEAMEDISRKSRSRVQAISETSAPMQEEPQQAHEIGLVSLSRGDDPRYIGPSSGFSLAKCIFSNTGWRGRHKTAFKTNDNALHFPLELLTAPALLPPRKEVAVELSKEYFRTIHVLYPFLHEQTHMRIIDEVYKSQDGDLFSSFQVYMVLAISSMSLSRQHKQQLPIEGYYASAMKQVDSICQHGSLAALQCLLLLMVYALYNPSCNINIWNLNYQCLATMIDLGLQRDIRASSVYAMPLFKQEMRTRVFWVVYSFDRTLCTMMGRPIGIRDEACDLRFPLEISDSELTNTTTASQSTSNGISSPMSLSIRLFKLAQLNSEIKYVMHSICRNVPSYAYHPVKDISAWKRSMLTTLISWYDETQLSGVRDNAMARYHEVKYHEIMILLLRPSPAIPDPVEEHLELCSKHAFALLQCFGDLYEAGNLLYSRLVVHSLFLGTLVLLHYIWKRPKAAFNFSIDQLIVKLNISQNILSSVGEHWGEAFIARDCIAQLSNITIQRLLKDVPSTSAAIPSSRSHVSAKSRLSSRNVEVTPTTPSSNVHGQGISNITEDRLIASWSSLQSDTNDLAAQSDYLNLFDDFLRTDFEGLSGMSDIDGLINEVLNSSHVETA